MILSNLTTLKKVMLNPLTLIKLHLHKGQQDHNDLDDINGQNTPKEENITKGNSISKTTL